MDALRALGVLPDRVRAEIDDDELLVFVRLDMLHLEADALHDRLQHWTMTELARDLPAARAFLSFRHATPADPHEASTLDLQEEWRAMEPTFALDMRAARPGDVERFAALVPTFLKLIEGKGRPAGFRSPDVGAME